MLSLMTVSSEQAGTYYTKDDYYLESDGEWCGKGAKNLNLTGKIKEDDFKQLIKGESPNNEFKIVAGGKEYKHIAGCDLTFSAPKSVSIAGLVLDDKLILEAHTDAVSKTLSYIENNLTKVRLKIDGRVLSEKTNNILTAKFQHISSRELDPQLHTHCLIINASQKENGDWRAVNYKEIYENKMFLGQMYRNELAKNLKDLGYQIENNNQGLFELKGLDKDILKSFSTRSEQIKIKAEELRVKFSNMGNAELKAIATIDSRKIKDEPTLNELKSMWTNKLNEVNINKEQLKNKLSNNLVAKNTPQDINQIINTAMKIHAETEAVIKKEDILKTAMKLDMGNYTTQQLEAALIKNQNLKSYNDGKFFATKEIVELEKNIVKEVKVQQNTQQPIMNESKVRSEITKYELNKGFNLTNDQRNAVVHILSTTDRIIAIQGDAGTGKTTMLDCVNQIVINTKQEIKLQGLSFTGKATYEIEKASGIHSQTIAKFTQDTSVITTNNTIYAIDEASMLSIKDMNALLGKLDGEFRIVLIGDTKQLQSIGAGKIFSTLQDEKAINTITMTENKRQINEIYKESTQLMANKNVIESFNKLDENNKIFEIKDNALRLNSIADMYTQKYKDTILLTATNSDRKELNNLIRDKLKEQNAIGKVDNSFLVRASKNLTSEQRHYHQNYNKGDLIISNNEILGKAGNEAYIIQINKDENSISVRDMSGNIHNIKLSECGQNLAVFKEENRNFTNGEKVIFLKNDKGLNVTNGQTATIQNVSNDGKMKVILDNGKEKNININKQYKYISHGYVITDYKAQGQTAKNVIYHADVNKNVNFNQAYVGITRGKEDIKIVTNDKEKFKEMIQEQQVKTTVHDFEKLSVNKSQQKEMIF